MNITLIPISLAWQIRNIHIYTEVLNTELITPMQQGKKVLRVSLHITRRKEMLLFVLLYSYCC